MRHRPVRLLAAAATLAVAALPLAASAAEGVVTTDSGVVGTDPDGDWGSNASGIDPRVGDALGQELKNASIIPSSDGRTLNFVIGLKSLPGNGGMPEVSRYTWNLDVDPTPHVVAEDGSNPDLKGYDIDGKWLNYTRGACDPTAGTCPPPRDPGQQAFFLRGDCCQQTVGVLNLTLCQEKATVRGLFDPAKATITIPIAADKLGLVPCATITGGSGTFGGSLSAAPSAFITNATMPMDTLEITGVFRVPSGTGEPCPVIPAPES